MNGQLSRQQRQQFARRLYSDNPGLEVVHPHTAGIDVGNESHFVAVPPGLDPQPVREFGSWTLALHQLADWLHSLGIQHVVMQSTGVYWIALYDILEQHGFLVCLTNARDTKNLPGRKTDVQESQWLMKLHTYGLLRNSFRPPDQIRQVRTVWRVRDRHVADAGREIQHMQKAMTTMNVQLANVISDISGVTGQAIIRAILKGERDPYKLAQLKDYRVRASLEEIARSLEGTWQPDVLFELKQAVDRYDFCQQQMAECDAQLQKYLAALPTRCIHPPDAGAPSEPSSEPTETTRKKKRKTSPSRPRKNQPQFDLRAELARVCGVDLCTLDGVKVMTVQTWVAELGVDMTPWPDEDHLVSWLKLCPRKRITGGKVIKQERVKVKNRVSEALRMAATTLIDSDSYLGARYRSLRAQRGEGKAVKAMAAQLARLIYRMLTRGKAWVDKGAEDFQKRRAQRELQSLERKAAARGFKLIPAA
jgi:hypothetical protein